MLAAAAVSSAAVLGFAAGASAAETTLGSTLADPYETTFGGTALTAYQEVAAPETLVAPAPGTITSWSVRSGDNNGEYELRILRPAGGGELTAVSTSSPHSVPNNKDEIRGPFAVSLAVKAGDHIGLYVIKGQGAPINNVDAAAADELNYVEDPFADGTTKKAALEPLHGGSQELLLSAKFKAGAPVNIAVPEIAGEARVGSPLTATEGSWEGASTFAYQWLRCLGRVRTDRGRDEQRVHADLRGRRQTARRGRDRHGRRRHELGAVGPDGRSQARRCAAPVEHRATGPQRRSARDRNAHRHDRQLGRRPDLLRRAVAALRDGVRHELLADSRGDIPGLRPRARGRRLDVAAASDGCQRRRPDRG